MRASILALILTSASALAEVPSVATDLPVVHSLVAQVMGELGEPVLLMDAGADAHDYQLRPSQARAVTEAGLVFWVGAEMTPWLDRAIGRGIGGKAVSLLEAPGTSLRTFEGEHQDDGEADAEHDHAGGADPHAWLDPDNGRVWLDLIAEELAALDPDNAGQYLSNAAAGKAAVDVAERNAAELLSAAKGKPIVVSHDAYGYFADHFGVTIAGSLAGGDATDPGAAHLREIEETLATAICIFPETQSDAERIAGLTLPATVRTGGILDPEGRGLETGPALYPALVESLAQTIADCVAG